MPSPPQKSPEAHWLPLKDQPCRSTTSHQECTSPVAWTVQRGAQGCSRHTPGSLYNQLLWIPVPTCLPVLSLTGFSPMSAEKGMAALVWRSYCGCADITDKLLQMLTTFDQHGQCP